MNNLKAYNLKELFAADFGGQSNRVGVAEYFAETQEIKLFVYPSNGVYTIDLERQLPLDQWLTHLNRKSWATSEVLGDFVKVWLQVNV